MEKNIQEFNFKGSRVLLHVMFWLAYIFFFWLHYAIYFKDLDLLMSAASLTMSATIDIAVSYFTVYYLLPKFLFKRKYVEFSILFIISAIAAIILQ